MAQGKLSMKQKMTNAVQKMALSERKAKLGSMLKGMTKAGSQKGPMC